MSRMRPRREAVFVCTYTTRSGAERVWVRAWTAEQARELVLAQLRDEGLAAGGEVQVAPLDSAGAPDQLPA
jgi:hypothetical protein